MATAQQLKALIKSYTAGDQDRFLSVAMQIAAHAARTGKDRLAEELRALVDEAKRQRAAGAVEHAVPIAKPGGDLAGLVAASYPKTRLSDMVLASATRSQLDRLVREYRQADLLRSHGLPPRRKLLLVGPPGCGKTMSASAIAGELGLPLLFVQLHSLITKFMGETAAKLHVVFETMARTRGVYLFDEFDAIGAHRGRQNDVGEIRRVLNSFLQFLERDDSDSLVVAATNLYEMLDDALFRRFDDTLHYELPDDEMIRRLIEKRLSLFGVADLGWKSVIKIAKGHSHAEIVRACEDAAKEAVLSDTRIVRTRDLVRALQQRPRSRRRENTTHRKRSD